MSRLDEIAKHAETHDFSTEMETGTWEADTEADPMVTAARSRTAVEPDAGGSYLDA